MQIGTIKPRGNIWRVILGLLLAPVFPILVFTYVSMPSFEWSRFTGMSVLIAAFAYPIAIVIGVPMYLVCLWHGWLRWYHATIAGFLSVWIVCALPAQFVGGYNTLNIEGHRIIEHGAFTEHGRLWSLYFQSQPALFGALGGLCFWWFALRRSGRA